MKKRIHLLLILITLFSLESIGQDIHFIKSYGNSGYDFGRDIKQDLDTGYIATGSSSSFSNGSADAFLLKVDSLGNFKWSYNYGGQETDWGESVVVTHDSSYAIGGYTNSFGAGGFDFYLVRADKDGTQLWEKTYGGSDWDRAHSIIQLADSGFVLVGDTYSYGNGNADIYMIRTDKNGDTLWTNTYGGVENDFGNAVILDGDSLVIVGGTESFGNGMSDGIILKYHMNGTFGWSKVVGKERNDYFTSIVSNNNGEYFLAGTRLYYFDQTGYLGDFWVYNIEDNGNTVIADTALSHGSHELEIAHDIIVKANDNVIYVGETKSFGQALVDFESDAYIGYMNSFYYSFFYVQNFGSLGKDVLYAVDYCYDKGVIGIGIMDYSSVGGGNLFIVKVDKTNSFGSIIVENDLTNEDITLSFENISNNLKLDIFPTPFTNNLIINGIPSVNKIKVYSINGEIVFEETNIDDSISLHFLNSGIYILNIETNGQFINKKIIKD
jgi:hypothetical protein